MEQINEVLDRVIDGLEPGPAKDMIKRVTKKLSTVPVPVVLTKIEWAQIIGIILNAKEDGLTGDEDIRFNSARKLFEQVGYE